MRKIIKVYQHIEAIQKNSWDGYFFNLPPYWKTELLKYWKKSIGHFNFTKDEILNSNFDDQQKSYLLYCLNKKLMYKNEKETD
jgi:hypothetical protein